MHRPMFFAATALAVVLSTPALAQASAEGDAGDIVVTARRVEERLQDVPISITVYNQAQINNRNITTATELATYTPSLQTNARFGTDKASFVIRGFGQIDTTSPTVGVYFDDVVALRAAAGTTSGNGAGPGAFFDLQNVQVLKGPQGTLFGRNTTGGAILLVPQKPTDRLEGYVEGSLGNYNLKRVQAVINVPLSDTFRVRAGFDRQKRDGYLTNKSGIGPKDFADSNYFSARVSLVGDLTPDLETYTVARYSRSDTHGTLYRLVACNPALFTPGVTPTTRGGIYASAACDQINRQNNRGDSFYDVENTVPNPSGVLEEWQVINTTTWKASDQLTVKNIVSYGEFQERFFQSIGGERLLVTTGPNAGKSFPTTIIHNFDGRYGAAQSTFTEELQFQGKSSDGRLIWQLGGYFEKSNPLAGGNTTASATGITCTDDYAFKCEAIIGPGAAPNLGLTESQIGFRNIGFYGQATYNITDQLAITGGARYTIDRTEGHGGRVTVTFPTPNNPVGVCANPKLQPIVGNTLNAYDCDRLNFVQKSSRPTWLIDLEYKPIRDIMIYAKYSRGYRQGGLNPSNVGLETWKPEKVDTYEAGIKTSFAGAVHGIFNLTGFYNNLTDQQLSVTAVGCTVATCGYNSGIPGARLIQNAGKSRIWGIEAETSITPFKGLKLDGGYTYLHTRLISFITPTLPVGGVFASVSPVKTGVDLPFSPHHRFTITGTYTLPLDESIGEISLGATYTYTTSQIVNADIPASVNGIPLGVVSPQKLLNLNLDWHSVGGSPIDLSAFVTNLTQEQYSINAAGDWISYGFEAVVPNQPRMWGVRLKYRFGS